MSYIQTSTTVMLKNDRARFMGLPSAIVHKDYSSGIPLQPLRARFFT